VNAEADAEEATLRLSMDAKAVVNVGPFARGGKNRILTKAADHDFSTQTSVTPVGIFLPALDEFYLYGVTSKVTSDCLVDRLIQWWESVKERFAQIKTLVINLDNGPENHSHRTQFMQRLLDFARTYQITLRLAYYPPYHSKYNPVERCWGILEHHWNGALLDSVNAIISFAQTMTWKGKRPVVELVTHAYPTGVTLAKEAMQVVKTHLKRYSSLENWFVDISPDALREIQQEQGTSLKRPRGRPRTKPLLNPALPKRPRGRPRTKPLPDPTLPKRPRGRPRKLVLAEVPAIVGRI
jgi:transposase